MNTKDISDWRVLEDLWEESVAILEYEAKYNRYDAEQVAAQLYGFSNKADFKAYIQQLKAKVA